MLFGFESIIEFTEYINGTLTEIICQG